MQMTPEIRRNLQDLEDLLDVRPKVKDENRGIYRKAWEFLAFFSGSTSHTLGAINYVAEKSRYYIREIESIRT